MSSWRTKDEKRSQFVRASFDFYDRYVLAGTLRRDGTDKFFKGKKYAYFPSVSVAWKIFNEKFMENVKWVDMLKLRASYGVTGRDNLGTTLYGAFDSSPSLVVFNEGSNQHISYYLSGLDYPSVSWEKTTMKNIGLDFSILKDRIDGSFDYFWNDVTDMLGTATSPGLSLLATYPINGAHIRRYGWDFTLNTKNIVTPDFKWSTTLTLSHYNSIWKERMPNYTWKEYQKRKDEPVDALYFYRTDGIVNADKSNIPSYQPEGYRNPGSPIIRDLNGDNQITEEDVDMVNVIPAVYGGLGNSFTYKNWDLDIFLYSQLGLKKYNYIYTWANGAQLASQNLSQSVLLKKYGLQRIRMEKSQVWHIQHHPFHFLVVPEQILGMRTLPLCVYVTLHWDIISLTNNWVLWASSSIHSVYMPICKIHLHLLNLDILIRRYKPEVLVIKEVMLNIL